MDREKGNSTLKESAVSNSDPESRDAQVPYTSIPFSEPTKLPCSRPQKRMKTEERRAVAGMQLDGHARIGAQCTQRSARLKVFFAKWACSSN